MTVRAVPYGYTKDETDKIVIYDKMAYYVQRIFEKWVQGESMSKIARWLKEERVLRKSGDYNWTHVTLGHILANSSYAGNEDFPAIISQELFDKVNRKREKHKNRTYCMDNKRYPLSYRVFCGNCSGSMYHKKATRQGFDIGRWKCSKDNTSLDPICRQLVVDDDILINQSIEVCNYVISNWSKVKTAKNNKFQMIQSPKLMQLDLEIRDELNKKVIDKGRVESLLNERTAEAWASAQVNDFSLKNKLMEGAIKRQASPLEHFDEEFFKKVIEHITLLSEGRVSFTLLNGVVLNRDYLVKK